jgi:hypothetical protein
VKGVAWYTAHAKPVIDVRFLRKEVAIAHVNRTGIP